MRPSHSVYPSKRTPSPRDEFTIKQFFLPIRINGEELWALLDTGAQISILPKEIASVIFNRTNKPFDDGTYCLARLIGVPYKSYKLDIEILDYIDETMSELDIMPYAHRDPKSVRLRNIEFQVPQLTWPEIRERLSSEAPVSVESHELDYAILGLHGVLDQLSLSFVGDNSVQVGVKDGPIL